MASRALRLSLFGLIALAQVVNASPAQAARTVALGVFQPSGSSLSGIHDFDRRVGKRVAIVNWFQSWANAPDFHTDAVTALVRDGRTPLITWEPWDWRPGSNQTPYSLQAIAAGQQDGYIRTWAHAARTVPGQVLIRFGHEMNANWYPWGAGVNGNTAADYVAAFRKVVTLFRAEGATNVRFIWAPNVEYRGSAPLTPLYPGDAYVDWVGIDGYNWGATQPWQTWQSFDAVFRSTYDRVVGIAPTKRFMISEFASSEVGGNKASWIANGLGDRIPKAYPRLEAIVWFNERKETDWRVNSSSAALAAFRKEVRSSTYISTLPG